MLSKIFGRVFLLMVLSLSCLALIPFAASAGQFTTFDLPKDSMPISIASSHDGYLWVVLRKSKQLLRFNKSTGQTTTYSLPSADGYPRSVIYSAGSIYVTSEKSLLAFSRSEETFSSVYDLPTEALPYSHYLPNYYFDQAMNVDNNGQVYFTVNLNQRFGGRDRRDNKSFVKRIDPVTNQVSTFATIEPDAKAWDDTDNWADPSSALGGYLTAIAFGKNNQAWLSSMATSHMFPNRAGRIMKLSPQGERTVFRNKFDYSAYNNRSGIGTGMASRAATEASDLIADQQGDLWQIATGPLYNTLDQDLNVPYTTTVLTKLNDQGQSTKTIKMPDSVVDSVLGSDGKIYTISNQSGPHTGNAREDWNGEHFFTVCDGVGSDLSCVRHDGIVRDMEQWSPEGRGGYLSAVDLKTGVTTDAYKEKIALKSKTNWFSMVADGDKIWIADIGKSQLLSFDVKNQAPLVSSPSRSISPDQKVKLKVVSDRAASASLYLDKNLLICPSFFKAADVPGACNFNEGSTAPKNLWRGKLRKGVQTISFRFPCIESGFNQKTVKSYLQLSSGFGETRWPFTWKTRTAKQEKVYYSYGHC